MYRTNAIGLTTQYVAEISKKSKSCMELIHTFLQVLQYQNFDFGILRSPLQSCR